MPIPLRTFSFLVALTGVTACVDPLDRPEPAPGQDTAARQVEVDEPGSPPADPGGAGAICKPITVTGKVFYNDLRAFGRFSDRKTIFPGIAGSPDPFSSSNDKMNYLGLFEGKVSIFEIDQPAIANGTCAATSFAGSTQIANDGTWSWTGTVCDSCRVDQDGANDNGVSIAAKIVLEKCTASNVRCFSVDDPQGQGNTNHYTDGANWGATWSRWYHNATSTSPVGVHQQATIDLGVDYFQQSYGLTPGVSTDLDAQAANLFASMVDVTRRVHLDEDLPYDHGTWGQIRAYFPSVTGGTAHSHQADRLCVSAPSTWLAGDEASHEYGHLTHYWAWAGVGKWGSFWYDSDGDGVTTDDQGESYTSREYAITAFKEAWAEFISRVTFDGMNVGKACAGIENRVPLAPAFTLFDGSLVCPAGPTTCTQGRYIVKDVEQTLCDLWDPVEVDAVNVDNDRLQFSLLDLQDNLTRVFLQADPADQLDVLGATSFGPTNTATAPLGLCRFAEKLVANGTSTGLLTETLAVNKINCNL